MNPVEKTPEEVCLDIIKKHADPLNTLYNLKLSIETEWHTREADKARCVCFHVIGSKPDTSDTYFCFSVVLTVPELKFGVWTRGSILNGSGLFYVVQWNSKFEPTSFDHWLNTWFENAVLEELTCP